MDALLIERWVGGGDRTSIHDEAGVPIAQQAARALGLRLGLPEAVIESLTLIVRELATNQLRHARYGVIA